MDDQNNPRILLIDDTPAIHADFGRILGGPAVPDALAEQERVLFGTAARRPPAVFQLDSAFQGQEGLARVQAGLAAGRPYAMAFVDMHMPPGWDGIATVERLWAADPRLQVVLCTAFLDHAWEDVLERLDVQDRLLIVKKPFDLAEVRQIARTLTAKWSLAQAAERRRRRQEAFDPARGYAPQDVDLGALVRELAAELRQLDPQHPVDVSAPPGLRVRADPLLLRAAVRNLLGNAWTCGRRDGCGPTRIEVGAAPAGAGPGAVFVRDDATFHLSLPGQRAREH